PGLLWAWIVACVECGGGTLLAIGLFTRLVSAALVIEFTVIVFVVKWANGFIAFAPTAIPPGLPGMIPGGFELELPLGLCCLAFPSGGSGRPSADQLIGKEIWARSGSRRITRATRSRRARCEFARPPRRLRRPRRQHVWSSRRAHRRSRKCPAG